MKKIVVLASGGLDSSTTALRLASDGYEVYPLFINYGQKSYFMEWGSVIQVFEDLRKKDLPLREPEKACITSIGEFHRKYDARREGAFFPFRNLILASIGALYGYHLDIFALALGLVKDHYPDCTPNFKSKLGQVLSEAVSKKISIVTPFIDQHKSDIVKYGVENGFLYRLTYSCYEGEKDHCGRCDGCKGRQKAFKEAGITDPTPYQLPAVID